MHPFPYRVYSSGSKFEFFCYKRTSFDDIANELNARMHIDRFDLKRRGETRANGKRGPILNKTVNCGHLLGSLRLLIRSLAVKIHV